MPDTNHKEPLPLPGTPAFKRLEDGYFMQMGACNPGAILRTMVRHMDADPSLHHDALCQDAGMRMMLHQLVYLVQTQGGASLEDRWKEDYDSCLAAYTLTHPPITKEDANG